MENSLELFDSIQEIKSREDLSNFIKLLMRDYQQNQSSWENITIESYLESIAEWILVMDTQYDSENVIEGENKWQTMAKIFYVGKIYE